MIYKKRVVIVNDNDLSNDINSAQEAADSAILEQQRIYYRSKEGRIPYGAADPTDVWITNHDDRYNELSNENAATAWSTKITPIARGIDSNENEDKYLYLYTCVQKRIVSKDAVKYTLSSDTTVNASKFYYERSGMTDNYVYTVVSNPSGNPHENQYYEQSPKVPHTEILLDETTTVIDGGKIITGSVMANRLNAASINAWHQLSIGAFDADTTKAISNSTYITFIDTQRGIHVHNVDDENNYIQINATDIQLVRANVPRMILGATNFSFHDANGTQRLLLNVNDGAIIGYTNNIYTQIKNDGFYIYDGASSQTNKKLTQITSSGLEIFDSTDGSSIAFYGQATRIGRAQKQRMEITSNDLRFYDTFNKVMLQFAAIKKNSSSTTNDAPWLCIGDASATRITLGITDAPYLYMNAGGTQCFSATSSGVQVGSSTNYALINTNGMEVFKGGTTAANSRAQFFDTIRLGSSTGQRITLSSTALEMYDENNQRRIRVNSGEGVIIGRPDKGRAVITDQGMTIYDNTNADVAFYGRSARIGRSEDYHVGISTDGVYFMKNNDSFGFFDSRANIGGVLYLLSATGSSVYLQARPDCITLYGENGNAAQLTKTSLTFDIGSNGCYIGIRSSDYSMAIGENLIVEGDVYTQAGQAKVPDVFYDPPANESYGCIVRLWGDGLPHTSHEADTYWLGVGSSGRLYTGTQINGATAIRWREIER